MFRPSGTHESRKDGTCLQFKMKKHYIQTCKISHKHREIYKRRIVSRGGDSNYQMGLIIPDPCQPSPQEHRGKQPIKTITSKWMSVSSQF